MMFLKTQVRGASGQSIEVVGQVFNLPTRFLKSFEIPVHPKSKAILGRAG